MCIIPTYHTSTRGESQAISLWISVCPMLRLRGRSDQRCINDSLLIISVDWVDPQASTGLRPDHRPDSWVVRLSRPRTNEVWSQELRRCLVVDLGYWNERRCLPSDLTTWSHLSSATASSSNREAEVLTAVECSNTCRTAGNGRMGPQHRETARGRSTVGTVGVLVFGVGNK